MAELTGNVNGRRNEMTESECWEIEKMMRKYGHAPILDLVAAIIEPHPADDDAEMRNARRSFANMLRGMAANLPDVRY